MLTMRWRLRLDFVQPVTKYVTKPQSKTD